MSFHYVVIRPESVDHMTLDIDDQVSETELGRTLLTAFQEAVGGYVEFIAGDQPFDVYINEEGLLKGLPQNKLAFAVLNALGVEIGFCPVGPVVLTRPDDESLRSSDIEMITLLANNLAFD